MIMLQAKTEKQQEHIGKILIHFEYDSIDENGIGCYGRGRISFDQMAEIVDYLREQK